MTLAHRLQTWPGAFAAAVVAHAVVLVMPADPGAQERLESVPFHLAELPELPAEPEPASEPEPEPEPEPPPPPPPPDLPPGPKNPDPEADPTKTSLESNRVVEDDNADAETPIVTGLPLSSDQLVDDGMALRVGNTMADGYDADVEDPGALGGFEGGGAGGGGTTDNARAALPGFEKAELLEAIEPRYPKELLTARTEGNVRLRLVISHTGRVESSTVLDSAHPALSASAQRAVKRFRYRPARLNGRRTESHQTVTIRFRIDER